MQRRHKLRSLPGSMLLHAALCTALTALAAGTVALAGPAATADPAAAAGHAWKAVAASGPVDHSTAAAPQAWHPVSRGDELAPMSMVRTGRKGRTTLARRAGVIIVDPLSHLQLPGGAAADDAARVIQTAGSAVYDVRRRAGGAAFEVVTPYLVAGVKGTVFGVSVTDGYAIVSVEEGTVEVRSALTGETVELGAGEALQADADGSGRMERVPRDAAPAARSDGSRGRLVRQARRNLKQLNDVAAIQASPVTDRPADRGHRARMLRRDDDPRSRDRGALSRNEGTDELLGADDPLEELEDPLEDLDDPLDERNDPLGELEDPANEIDPLEELDPLREPPGGKSTPEDPQGGNPQGQTPQR